MSMSAASWAEYEADEYEADEYEAYEYETDGYEVDGYEDGYEVDGYEDGYEADGYEDGDAEYDVSMQGLTDADFSEVTPHNEEVISEETVSEVASLPKFFLNNLGCVTTVKMQLSGGCWTYACAAALESAYLYRNFLLNGGVQGGSLIGRVVPLRQHKSWG